MTANAVWGNEAAVLVGDFLYSRAFEMMVDANDMRIMEVMSHATNTIAEGEVLQLLNCNDPETDQTRYREVILRKTATLFEAGARLAAVINAADPGTEDALAAYGLHLGMAFQMIDDALDYAGFEYSMGKTVGDDFRDGILFVPEVLLAANAMKAGMAILRPLLAETGAERTQLLFDGLQRGSVGLAGERVVEPLSEVVQATCDVVEFTCRSR